jgi:hypothetical protein
MLSAIKSNKKADISKYDDLIRKTIVDCNNNVDISGKLEVLKNNRKESTQQSVNKNQAISSIISLGYDPETAFKVIEALFENDPELTCDKAVVQFLTSFNSGLPKTGMPIGPSLKEIINNTMEHDCDATEALESAGLIYKP